MHWTGRKTEAARANTELNLLVVIANPMMMVTTTNRMMTFFIVPTGMWSFACKAPKI